MGSIFVLLERDGGRSIRTLPHSRVQPSKGTLRARVTDGTVERDGRHSQADDRGVFLESREVAHASSSSKNKNYGEEHFVRNGLFTGCGRSCTDCDSDRAALWRKGVWRSCEPI